MTRLLVLVLFLCSAAVWAEDLKAPAIQTIDDLEVVSALIPHSKKFETTKARFHGALKKGRPMAVRNGLVEEVKNIDLALQGATVEKFEQYGTKAAKKSYDSALKRLSKSIEMTLKNNVKKILAEESGVARSEVLLGTIDSLSKLREEEGGEKSIKINVFAHRDWQTVNGLEVEKGQMVSLSCVGAWAPGSKNNNTKANADTYRVGVGINNKTMTTSGKSSTFKATKSGTLCFRLAVGGKKRFSRAEASGSMQILVRMKTPEEQLSLEMTLMRILAKASEEAKKEDRSEDGSSALVLKKKNPSNINVDEKIKKSSPKLMPIKKIVLKGNMDWQDMETEIKKGQFVSITAEGSWTSSLRNVDLADQGLVEEESKGKKRKNRKKRKKRDQKLMSPNELNIEGKIGDASCGIGGITWTFFAKNDGALTLRMRDYDELSKKGTPGGTLNITIKILSGD